MAVSWTPVVTTRVRLGRLCLHPGVGPCRAGRLSVGLRYSTTTWQQARPQTLVCHNILDLAFISDTSQVLTCENLPPLGRSDHRIVKLETKLPVLRISSEPRKIFLYSKGDYNGMKNMFAQEDWQELLASKDIETNWSAFKAKYLKAIERFVPHKMAKAGRRLKVPWTRYKSVWKARTKQRHRKVEARKSSCRLYPRNRSENGNRSSLPGCQGTLWGQDCRAVKGKPKTFLELYPPLHKII